MKKITVIGGGTGSYVVLTALKPLPLDLAAIVTMMDSGGSTGRLRDQLGVLPPGDLRQCLVALSEAPELWRKLFLYRFENGDLKGHNFGNLFLSALEKVCEDYNTVLETVSYVLKTKGKVIPVTFDKTHLCVQYENGTVIKGEGNIDENNPEISRIVRSYLEPAAKPNDSALKRIHESDYLIIGPGDLYTSIVPILIVDGIRQAIMSSHAKIIFFMNLMTKIGQTSNYTAQDFLTDLTRYLGKEPDYLVVNNGVIPQSILDWYALHHEQVVENNLDTKHFRGTILKEDLINRNHITKSSADALTRSILRHDSKKLTEVLAPLFKI